MYLIISNVRVGSNPTLFHVLLFLIYVRLPFGCSHIQVMGNEVLDNITIISTQNALNALVVYSRMGRHVPVDGEHRLPERAGGVPVSTPVLSPIY